MVVFIDLDVLCEHPKSLHACKSPRTLELNLITHSQVDLKHPQTLLAEKNSRMCVEKVMYCLHIALVKVNVKDWKVQETNYEKHPGKSSHHLEV